MKYVIVSGGVVSGLGKGITISSLGVLLKSSGYSVTAIKIDPYLNVDAGTMSPFEHGEVFVLNDGGEADLDLGNYERFLDIQLTKDHNITTGKVYQHVIMRERRGDYLGKTVQIVPHVTDTIQDWIQKVSQIPTNSEGKMPDICLLEVGGTVGDIESSVFLEAIRQFMYRVGPNDVCLVHVSLVPVLGSVGEQKTKPTQHGVKELRSAGLSPDIIVCRSQLALDMSTKEKIAMFCQVPCQNVVGVRDVSNIYHVPLVLDDQLCAETILKKFGLPFNKEERPFLTKWRELAIKVDSFDKQVKIALVGKYTGLQDSYLSVIKALKHASIACERDLVVEWIEAATLEKDMMDKDLDSYNESWKRLKAVDGILVPGGFGDRGVEGKILSAKYARENKVPYLGICLGMQVAVIEYSRSILGFSKANSEEFDASSDHKVIIFMPEIDPTTMGGTMRLGERPTILKSSALVSKTIAKILHNNADIVLERHRHRYEVNPKYVEKLTNSDLIFSGVDDKGERMEIVELPRSTHPFYFATQYHPEFKSRPTRPSPPFMGLILAASNQFNDKL